MELDRITIENDMDYLRQTSTPVDFENDNYKDWIEALKEYCQNNAVYKYDKIKMI